MPIGPRSFFAQLRARVGRSMRSAGSWVGPQDPASLASRLDKGEIVWRAFVDAGSAMRRCGRFAEADRMLERGLGAFPEDATLLYEYAMSAHESARYALAIARWQRAVRAASGLAADRAAMCRSGLAANLRETGALDRAQREIDEARRLFPDDLVVLSEAARVADARGADAQALGLWRLASATPDPPEEWVQGEISALLRLGRLAAAAQALALAQSRFPDAPGLMRAEALLATSREEWPEAVATWTAYRARFPDDDDARDQLAKARLALARLPSGRLPSARPATTHGEDGPGNARGPAATEAGAADHREALLASFEGIGDSCEFALVQRRFAVEPAGLLSWSTLTLDALLSALEQRFAGLGAPENSELATEPDGEFVVCDRRWQLRIHTATFAGQAEREALLAESCRRIAALRDRLLADLAAAEKVFVYRSQGLDGDSLELLHRALCAIGPVRLLNVQPAAPTAPTLFQGRAGDVLQVGRNRFVGFLERLGADASGRMPADPAIQPGPGRGSPDIAFADWLAICRKTAAAA